MTRIKLLVVEKTLHDTNTLNNLVTELNYDLVARVKDKEEAKAFIHLSPPDLVLFCSSKDVVNTFSDLSETCHQKNIPFLYLCSATKRTKDEDSKPTLMLAKPLELSTLRNLSFSSIQQMSKGYSANGGEEKDFLLKENYFIKKNNTLVKVPIKNFLFIQSDGNYCAIQTDNGKFMVRRTLTWMEKTLPRKQFVRTHKSFIVKLAAVEQVAQTNAEILIQGRTIPIGRKFRDDFYDRLKVLN